MQTCNWLSENYSEIVAPQPHHCVTLNRPLLIWSLLCSQFPGEFHRSWITALIYILHLNLTLQALYMSHLSSLFTVYPWKVSPVALRSLGISGIWQKCRDEPYWGCREYLSLTVEVMNQWACSIHIPFLQRIPQTTILLSSLFLPLSSKELKRGICFPAYNHVYMWCCLKNAARSSNGIKDSLSWS